jgi:excisionase family DNA binding protein
MIYGTEAHQATERPVDAGATLPVCRRLFSVEQAAEFAGVSVEQIWRWVMTGKLEAYRLYAGRVRIDEVELADLLSAR